VLKKNKLHCAVVATIVAATGAGTTYAGPTLEEVVVTATKRAESAQDIPVTVQALGGETLNELNVNNFDDYIRFLPNVTSGGRGPGQSEIYIRGMSIDAVNVMLSGAQGTTPNVALYLDEQPVTSPGRNLDVYIADMERVEVLAGPQGTLFGASSQAGTVRLITNKPDLGEFQAGFNTDYSGTEHGEPSSSVKAFINIPVIEDTFAVRAVIYNAKEGGYIDNTLGTYTLDPNVNTTLPADADYSRASVSNSNLVEEDFNDASYNGIRVSALYAINADWTLLAGHMAQTLEVDGVFDYDPEVGDLEVNRYFPDELEDVFNQTTWTLEGRLAALDIVYTGAYLDRDVEQSIDYTGYNNSGPFIAYYTCTYDAVRECLDPTKGFRGQADITRQTHEFRIATPEENRTRLVAGVFYDKVEIKTLDDYYYFPTPGQREELGFALNSPIPTAKNIDQSTRPSGVGFFNDITRTEQQIAAFGELSYDIVPDELTVTLGMRYYESESDFTGSTNFANGPFTGGVDQDSGRDYDLSGGHTTEPLTADDIITKVNLSYMPTDDTLFYGTYSEGFRPGGFNRGGGVESRNPSFSTIPITYETDNVKNYEFGWKTTLADGSLRFNGSVYFIDWTDMQVSRFDPINVSVLTFIDNSADSEIRGIDTDIVWAATDHLTLFTAFSYIETELVATQSEVIELAPIGSRLALTPTFQGNVRARYEWELGGYSAYWQTALSYTGNSFSSVVVADRREQDSYATADASIGVNKDGWGAELFVENLTDERAQLFYNVQDDVPRITTNRPRTIGVRFSYDI
jgi:iron complex outermembrane recepter protein